MTLDMSIFFINSIIFKALLLLKCNFENKD